MTNTRSLERSRAFARAWGSELVELSNAGHINGDAGYGPWPEGLAMLEKFTAGLKTVE